MKLSNNFYNNKCYWAHMITFRCNANCPYCILKSRGKNQSCNELSSKEILNFWNNIEHNKGQKLSLIGGEPTLHKDIIEIVNGLEDYSITMTTNCKGPFYNNRNFYKKFKPKATSTLRINTTFHPHHITSEEYIEVIKIYRQTGYFVDQTSYVYNLNTPKYENEINKVSQDIKITAAPYLGFCNSIEGFNAIAHPNNLSPRHCQDSYPDCNKKSFCIMDAAKTICGITDLEAFKDICGQYVGKNVTCEHPFLSLIISPNGEFYHCHYKLYYGIDPVCHISEFKSVNVQDKECNYYGFCNFCDVPRIGCKKNTSAKPLVLNTLYNRHDLNRREINHIHQEITEFSKTNSLEYNRLKWFEYGYCLLYSGHKHNCKVLDIGSAKSVIPYYMASKGYNVTTIDIANDDYRKEIGIKYKVKSEHGDMRKHIEQLDNKFDLITMFSVIEHINTDTKAILNIARYLKKGGVLFVSTDFYPEYIEYPNANRNIVKDRDPNKCTDSRVYSPAAFMERVIRPLEEIGIMRIGNTNYENIDINDPTERAVRGLYTFGIAIFRKEV